MKNKIIFLSFVFSFVFYLKFCLADDNFKANLKLKLSKDQVLVYQQANYYYIPFLQVKKDFNSQERIIFSIKNLKIDNVNNEFVYTNEYRINTLISQNFKQDTLNLINNFLLKGFKVIFIIKSNYELIYSPEIVYFYEKLPDYEKNKQLINDLKSSEYFLNIVKNSIEWMKPLNSKEITAEYQNGYVKFNIKTTYSFVDYKKLNLSKKLSNVNTIFYKAEGRVLSVSSDLNLFNGLELIDSNVSSFEYYEKDTNIPVLLQREIKLKFNILDDNLKRDFYKKTNKTYFEFQLLRTLMLVSM
ncbi:MAG: hypothetical protein N2485_02695 [bacterium]|nr:hypothetical protein [bacterium]